MTQIRGIAKRSVATLVTKCVRGLDGASRRQEITANLKPLPDVVTTTASRTTEMNPSHLTMVRIRLAIAVLLVTTLLSSRPAEMRAGQLGPIGGVAVGVVLQQAADRLNTAINTAGTNGRLIAIEAGQQLWLAIYNAQQAYAGEREKTVRELNQAAQGNIQTLVDAVSRFERDALAAADEILQQAQQVSNTLPFSNKTPQVRGYSPCFIVNSGTDSINSTFQLDRIRDLIEDLSFLQSVSREQDAARTLGRELSIIAANQLTSANSRGAVQPVSTRPGGNALPPPPDPGVPNLIRLEINGNFPAITRQDMTPTLRTGTDVAMPAGANTQQLLFLVPRSRLAQSPSGGVGYTTFELIVPYRKGAIFPRRHEARFKLLIASLPPAVGRIEYSASNIPNGSRRDTRPKETAVIAQHSNDDDHDLVHCGPAPLEGWTVDPSTVRFEAVWSQGNNPDDWRFYHVSSNPQPCYRVVTVKRTWGTSGKVNFKIRWKEFTMVALTQNVNETFDVLWGESRSFPHPPGTWLVKFTSFDDRTPREFRNNTGPQNKYLRLAVTPTDVTLFAPQASELKW